MGKDKTVKKSKKPKTTVSIMRLVPTFIVLQNPETYEITIVCCEKEKDLGFLQDEDVRMYFQIILEGLK